MIGASVALMAPEPLEFDWTDPDRPTALLAAREPVVTDWPDMVDLIVDAICAEPVEFDCPVNNGT